MATQALKTFRCRSRVTGDEKAPCGCAAEWFEVRLLREGETILRPGLFSGPCSHGNVLLSRDFDSGDAAELLGFLCQSTT